MSSGIKLINGRNTLLTDENSLKKKEQSRNSGAKELNKQDEGCIRNQWKWTR